jgi:ParB family chromosome partitioning protein
VAQSQFDQLTEQYQTVEELSDDVDAQFGELEAEIGRLEAKRQAYDPDDIARSGAFVILNHDGTIRIERGFVRPGDEKPQSEAEQESRDRSRNGSHDADGQSMQDNAAGAEVPARRPTTGLCPTLSSVTSPHIVPWGCASL